MNVINIFRHHQKCNIVKGKICEHSMMTDDSMMTE